MTSHASQHTLRLLDAIMAAAALVAFCSVLVVYGLGLGRAHPDATRIVNVLCAMAFAGAQCAKLLVVPDPRAYLRSHRADFVILFVLGVQFLIHAGLRHAPEYRWLARHAAPSPLWPLFAATLQVGLVVVVLLRSAIIHRLLVRLRLRPVQILVTSFALLIAAGTMVLALPGAAADGRPVPLVDALFTATSATCITGLAVWDTGTHFSTLGAAALLLLIQAGGLGMLTITGSFAIFGGKGLHGDEAEALSRALQVESGQEMAALLRRILSTTIVVEAAGAVALYAAWSARIPDGFERAGWAAFHAVSAFCNAGFALFPGHASLTGVAQEPATLAIVALLIVAGGLGFGVLADLARRMTSVALRRKAPGLASTTRWTIAATAFLLAAGAAGLWAMERNGVLGGAGALTAAGHAAFQSVSLRTAGFNSVALGALGLPATVLCIAWMLVGGGPGGTAGGMKATTAAVVVAGLFRPRSVPRAARAGALRLALLFVVTYAGVTALLALAQGEIDRRVAFEAASALGTVGLSLDYTAHLGTPAKLVLCAAMFAGRVGPFALVASALGRFEDRGGSGAGERIALG